MKTLQRIFFKWWRLALVVLSIALVAYLLYFHRLGKLLPGYSRAELQTLTDSDNWHNLVADPINAPYKLFVWLFTAVAHHGALMTRVVSACFGTLAVFLFFLIIRPWYTFRMAFLGTLLFATSAGFLHSARLGTPQVLQMSILLLITAILWYRRQQERRVFIGYWVAALFALLWYVPGMIWFEALGCALLWQGLLRQLRHMPRLHVAGWGITFAALVTPLLLASIARPHLLLAAAGLPTTLDAVSHVATNFVHAVLSIGIQSNGGPLSWVGHAPLLNITELVLGAIGAYWYLYRERSLRAVFLTGATTISVALISCGGSVTFASLVPLLYLFIVHGLDHFLVRWQTVFPRNPIARLGGLAAVLVLVFFSMLYQVRIYFVAWPHNTAVRQTFSLPPSLGDLVQ